MWHVSLLFRITVWIRERESLNISSHQRNIFKILEAYLGWDDPRSANHLFLSFNNIAGVVSHQHFSSEFWHQLTIPLTFGSKISVKLSGLLFFFFFNFTGHFNPPPPSSFKLVDFNNFISCLPWGQQKWRRKLSVFPLILCLYHSVYIRTYQWNLCMREREREKATVTNLHLPKCITMKWTKLYEDFVLFIWVWWHINLCGLFNATSILYE